MNMAPARHEVMSVYAKLFTSIYQGHAARQFAWAC